MTEKTLGYGQALGNTGIGLNSSKHLNFVNPASFAALDSGNFVFEVGIKSQQFKFKLGDESAKSSTTNIEYIAAGFPVSKWWKMGVAMSPFSKIGYEFNERDTLGDIISVKTYYGDGGFNQITWSHAIEPVKNLSLGVNAVYVFGETTFSSSDYISSDILAVSAYKDQWITVNGFLFETGLQYTYPIDNKKSIVVGLLFVPDQTLKFKNKEIVYTSDSDTLEYADDDKADSDYPMKLGAGVSYRIKNKLNVAFDFSQQNWKDKSILQQKNNYYRNSNSFSMGCDYTPDRYTSHGYFKRVSYRLGARYVNTYLSLPVTGSSTTYPVSEYAFSFGLGIPLKQSENNLNLSVETGMKGTSSDKLVKERFTNICVNFTLHDRWFHKRKID